MVLLCLVVEDDDEIGDFSSPPMGLYGGDCCLPFNREQCYYIIITYLSCSMISHQVAWMSQIYYVADVTFSPKINFSPPLLVARCDDQPLALPYPDDLL